MNLEFLERKDFWSGLLLIVTGGGAIFIARNYAFGSSLRMGPGYFPIVLGGLLILFGLYVAAMSLRADAEKLNGPWLPRLLVVLPLMLVLFGVTLNNRDFFYLAGIAIAIGAALAIPRLRRGEALGLSTSSRALVILPLSLVLFGLLIDRAGFIPAMLVLIFASATASTQFKWVEMLVFSILLTTLCVIVFVRALGLPYELIAGFW